MGGERTRSTAGPAKEHPELSLQDMRRGHYHSLKEARQLLLPSADWRSLRGWIADLGITTYKSPVRGHTLLISHKDLAAIAALVGRGLREDSHIVATNALPPSETGRREGLETIEALKSQHQKEIAELQTRHAREIETLQRQLHALQAWAEAVRLPARSAPPSHPFAGRASLPRGDGYRLPVLSTSKRKPHKVPSDLPAGTVSMRTFAEVHGTTREILRAAIRRREQGSQDGLEAIGRPYGGNPARIQYFFTPTQQDLAVVYLDGKKLAVIPCPDCPHAKEPLS